MKACPLILVHGYPFDHTMWYSTIASLGCQARVIPPDLPGFGKNPPLLDSDPILKSYADFLAGLLDENNIPQAVVAGMSMGGYVALAFAEKYPKRLAGLGLISTQASADTPEARKGRREMIEKIKTKGPRAAVEAMLPKAFAKAEPANPELKSYLETGADRAGVEGLCWALEAMSKRPDRSALIKELYLPVLVVHGTEDQIVPVNKARDLVELCQKPIMVEIRNAGHATPLEAPDQVATGLARLMKASMEPVAEPKPAEAP
jgi:pimeloyl-ACP methyl ester carboxylesterase